jgi:pimeloyl-ACP methyl ester carboxylesterase
VLRSLGPDLFGETHGEGPVRVVWLHGWARRGDDFAPAAQELARRGVASATVDLPGFGASAAPVRVGGARVYAELITPSLETLVGGPVVLVGHSFGGTVATVIAANRPDLVRALVLVGSPVLRDAPASRAARGYRLVRWARRRGLVGEARLERARQRYGSTDYKRASGVMRDVLVASVNESLEDELARISVPVTFVWGEGDTVVPVEVAVRAARLVGGDPHLEVLAGVGHLVPVEAPGALAATVEGALAA